MYHGKSICVVVPCYNEETQIANVVNTMPPMVDSICIVDDRSRDRTVEVVRRLQSHNTKIHLIAKLVNGGVGEAIADGYIYARDEGFDVAVVMAGDGQMDPDDLERVVAPVVSDEVDYCKGNRFKYPGGLAKIPKVRKFGNFLLSALTKIASGYWHVTDSQTGYTAINSEALHAIDVRNIYPRYGCPNDILVKLNIASMRVGEVPVNPLYGVGEQSKMNVRRVAGPMLWLVFRLWFVRIFQKYVIQNGHPIVGVMLMSALAFGVTAFGVIYILIRLMMTGIIPGAALVMTGIAFITWAQFLLNAMHMDYEYNQPLCVMLRSSMKRITAKVKKPAASAEPPGEG